MRLNVRVGDGDGAQWVNVTAFDEKAIEAADKMVKAARVYIEGSIKLDEWTAQDGSKRHGLSVLSRHCRIAAIGHNKPRRQRDVTERSQRPGGNDDAISTVILFRSR